MNWKKDLRANLVIWRSWRVWNGWIENHMPRLAGIALKVLHHLSSSISFCNSLNYFVCYSARSGYHRAGFTAYASGIWCDGHVWIIGLGGSRLDPIRWVHTPMGGGPALTLPPHQYTLECWKKNGRRYFWPYHLCKRANTNDSPGQL